MFADICLVFGTESSSGGVVSGGWSGDPLKLAPESIAWAVDESFQFGETNVTLINDIELFPDGRIVYGGTGRFESLGIAEENGEVENQDSYGGFLATVKSLSLDPQDRAIYSVGSGAYILGGSVQRTTSWDDFGWTARTKINGTGSKILRLDDRDLLVAGNFQIGADTNFYGLVRLNLAGRVDESFAYTNFLDLDIKSTVMLADGSVIATYLRTNGNLTWSEAGRWLRDGRRDVSYNGMWAESFGTNSQVTALAKAPGTNGFVAAIRTEPVSGGGSFFSRIVTFDEAGNWQAGIPEMPGDYIEGTVNAIAFEVVNPVTATNDGYDRIIIGGEFARIGTNDCKNLASFDADGSVAWCFPTNFGPNAAIHDVAVQLDGRVLIAGAFTNVNGIEPKGLARVYGSSATIGATYLYWADTEFTDFEYGLQNHSSPITMRRRGNTAEPLTVFLACEHPLEGVLVNVPTKLEFGAGEAQASAGVGILNNLQRGTRERFQITASVTNSNVLITRAKTDFVVLDDETPGTLDPWLNIPPMPGLALLALQEDTKMLFGGYGASLVRLDANGVLETGFVTNGIPRQNLGTYIYRVMPQSDGKIYVSGDFTTSAGMYGINHIARLNSDGTLDATFDPRLSRGTLMPQQETVKMLVDKNGEVVVWLGGPGIGVQLEGLFPTVGIVRLNQRGSLIAQYQGSTPHRNGSPSAWALGDDGELVTATSAPNGSLRKYNRSGQLLTDFVATVPNGSIYDVLVDGNVVFLGGDLRYTLEGVSNLVQIDFSTGAIETNFSPRINGPVTEIKIYDGKLYIAGDFTEVNGHRAIRVARLNMDGSLDESFDVGLGPNRPLSLILFQGDGKPLLSGGGSFNRVDGVWSSGHVRLQGDQRPGEIRFVSRRIELSETNQFVTIEVERVDGSVGPLSTTMWTVEGSALAGQHFESTNVTVTFADGEFGRRTIRIPIFESDALTGNRTFSVVLGTSTSGEEATVVLREASSPLIASAVVGSTTNAVRDMAVDPQNGWVYLVGSFTNVNEAGMTNFVRLNSELEPDESFPLSVYPAYATTGTTNFFEPIDTVTVSDKGIAIGGRFNRVGTNQWANVIRVRNDGTFDAEYNTAIRTAVSGTLFVRHILYEPDGQLVASIQTAVGSVRYNSNGSRDNSFIGNTGFGSDLWLDAENRLYDLFNTSPRAVRRSDSFGNQDGFRIPVTYNIGTGTPPTTHLDTIAIQPDGKALVGGAFTHAVNVSALSPAAPRFVRVLTNGLRDTNFVAVVGTNTNLSIKNRVSAIQPLADGSILIGGRFEVVNGERRSMLALLDTNGVLRSDFNVEVVGETIEQIALLPDGEVLVRGNVSMVDGVPIGNVFKLAMPEILPPVAKFLWPTNGAEVRVSDVPDEIRMHVFDPDGYIERVVLELDGQPIATNSSGNVPVFAFLPASGEHTLRVTATDASGLSATETVTFRTKTVVMEPSLIVQRSGGEVVITYQAARLQESFDLVNWTDAHAGGGEFRPAATESHRFYRAAGP